MSGWIGALAVLLGGGLVEWWRFGLSERAALTHVARTVRQQVTRDLRLVETTAHELAARPEVVATLDTADAQTPALFDVLDRALSGSQHRQLAATVYNAAGAVMAWRGRPGEVPPHRLRAASDTFLLTDPRGVRLVALAPVVASDGPGGRVGRPLGVVAVERTLAGTATPDRAGAFSLTAGPVTVSLLLDATSRPNDRDAFAFEVARSDGRPLFRAWVSPRDLASARRAWRNRVVATALGVVGLTLVLLAGPILDWRARASTMKHYLGALAVLLGLIVGARAVLLVALSRWTGLAALSPAYYSSTMWGPLLGSPLDFLLTALALLALVAIAADGVGRWRLDRARRRWSLSEARRLAAWVLAQTVAGILAGALGRGYLALLADTIDHTTLDPLHFSLHPWNGARLALLCGLLAFHAALAWSIVLLFVAVAAPWRPPPAARRLAPLLWAGAATGVLVLARDELGAGTRVSMTALLGMSALAAFVARRGLARYRRWSGAARLVAMFGGVVLPSILLYPAVAELAEQAKRRLVETRFAPQAIHHRQELQARLAATLETIDATPDLAALVAAPRAEQGGVDADSAFALWRRTPLASARLTSSIELYDRDGAVRSRFALNFPEYSTAEQRWVGKSCRWEVFGEVVVFGAQSRQTLHAERAVCLAGGEASAPRILGGIVVHVMLDYRALPFISSQSPYLELFRGGDVPPSEDALGRDVELAIYGWALLPLFTSTGDAWVIDEATFARLRASRHRFWTVLRKGATPYHVYLANDRAGIYAMGYPIPPFEARLVHLAELATLAGVAFVIAAVGLAAFTRLARRRGMRGREILREIRASFYRRLFLAFVLAAAVPAVVLAVVIRTYFASRLRMDVEAGATRTVLVAQRVVEEALALQQRAGQAGLGVTDEVLVWIAQIIDQGVNIFDGPRLAATSERDLFASGLLPTRTPAEVYRAIAIERRPTFVGEDRIGPVRYLLAAAPVRAIDGHAILTVPLLPRQQEIEREIDELDRGIRLGALLFLLLGAALGYSMAQRIADPVSRLTRAARRIARGDLDARLATRTADELGSLVDAFNRMTAELKAQRQQLERTSRLEAWAEMARQVAHDIKNPLTPIQLSADHLLRVHQDRGEPLSPVLERCVDTIFSQVRLLRQIAAEFASFASSPTPQPAPTDVGELIADVIAPYRSGLGDRIALEIAIPPALPPIFVDRALMARALTNVIENALHAMPGGGRLVIDAAAADGRVRIRIADTGVGMDEAAQARVFEPYFSTKATGTGLGLTIAKRNVELNGGTITVTSEKGRGTTVILTVPAGAGRTDE